MNVMGGIDKTDYARSFGPTVGDRVRLADTELLIEVEADHTLRGGCGDEARFGRGGSVRDGMGQSQSVNGPGHHEAADCVITNALIVDHWGIVKADIGLKGCRIAAIGKAGNPDVMDGIDIVIGPGTEVIAGEGLIATAGAVDSAVRFISPRFIHDALAAGVTTMLGGGTGAASGSLATGATPGAENLHRMLQAADAFAMNLGFFGKGSASRPEALSQQIAAGAIGLTLHENWGATPAAIANCLDIAEVTDTQVSLSCDTLGESGFVDDTLAATQGRTLVAVLAGAAGLKDDVSSAAQTLRLVAAAHVLPTSTQVLPLAAEALLHDLGAISMFSSHGVPMHDAGAFMRRAWQTAHTMKLQRGALAGDSAHNDNTRVKRYIAKYTLNPAIAGGVSHDVGSIEIGKWADLVLWRPALFGVRPSLVLKGGFIAAAALGEHGTNEPMFGARSRARTSTSLSFVSRAALRGDIGDELGLHKRLSSVQHCRHIGKSELVHNRAMPMIEVDARSGAVRADGELLQGTPAAMVQPLAQRYHLF